MHRKKTPRFGHLMVLLAMTLPLAAPVSTATAVEINFDLDDALSSLFADMYVLDVDDFAGPQPSTADPPVDSRLASYSGTMTIDVDDPMAPTSLAVLSTNAVAATTGDWLPEAGGGSEGDPEIDGDADPGLPAPGNYGWLLDLGDLGRLDAAVRDAILNISSDPIAVSSGQFIGEDIRIAYTQGFYDQNVNSVVFGDDAGTLDLSMPDPEDPPPMNISTFLATYEVEGDIATLTIPLEFILGEGSDIEVTMTGELVGTASLAAGFAADFNKDGEVDGDDFLIWQQAFGTTSGATSNTGDANGDGAVNGDDFLLWQQEFGSGVAGQGAGGVPEPTSLGLLVAITAAAGLRRTRAAA